MKLATPIKLRSGDWGAKIEGCVPEILSRGEEIQIQTRAGKTWNTRIDKIVWSHSDKKIAIVALASKTKSRREPCANCDTGRGIHLRRDSSGLEAKVCNICNREDQFSLSFA